ncbi:MAG: VCBS repeat-containing protein [Polyangiaceae bacterium]|nr:VCBS repeat-containing protein [Polyangiaceae bacterium]
MGSRAATHTLQATLAGALLAGALGCPGPEPHAVGAGGTGGTGGGATGGGAGAPPACFQSYHVGPECYVDVAIGTATGLGMPVVVVRPDNHPDLAVPEVTAGTRKVHDYRLTWTDGTTVSTTDPFVVASSDVAKVLAGDFDALAGTDLAIVGTNGVISFAQGTTAGLGAPVETAQSFPGMVDTFVGHWDGDGRPDLGVLLCPTETTCNVTFLRSVPAPTYFTAVSPSAPAAERATGATLAGFDGADSYSDLVTTGAGAGGGPSGQDYLLFDYSSGGGQFDPSPTSQQLPAGVRATAVLVNELDGGLPDFVVTGDGPNGSILYLQGVDRAQGTALPAGEIAVGGKTYTPTIVDLDGDGYRDLVASVEWANGTHGVLFARGNPSLGPPFEAPVDLLAGSVLAYELDDGIAVAYLNGDSYPDIILNHPGPGAHVLVAKPWVP